MSTREVVYTDLNRELRLTSSQSVLFSEAVAEAVGLHSTDVECIDLLNLFGPMTAGQLAERTGLTSGAITRLIDRLERAGFVRREADPKDRRRVIVVANAAEVQARIFPYFAPLGRRMGELWARYGDEQLALVVDFIRESNRIMGEEIARVRKERDEGARSV
ncbi:MAG: MarR family winged helix-turn-helix transcriptional regulator [Hyphomicrobiales bacterium]